MTEASQCPVCLTSKQLRTVCSNNHGACLECLEGLVRHSDDGVSILCPLCREQVLIPDSGVSTFPLLHPPRPASSVRSFPRSSSQRERQVLFPDMSDMFSLQPPYPPSARSFSQSSNQREPVFVPDMSGLFDFPPPYPPGPAPSVRSSPHSSQHEPVFFPDMNDMFSLPLPYPPRSAPSESFSPQRSSQRAGTRDRQEQELNDEEICLELQIAELQLAESQSDQNSSPVYQAASSQNFLIISTTATEDPRTRSAFQREQSKLDEELSLELQRQECEASPIAGSEYPSPYLPASNQNLTFPNTIVEVPRTNGPTRQYEQELDVDEEICRELQSLEFAEAVGLAL